MHYFTFYCLYADTDLPKSDSDRPDFIMPTNVLEKSGLTGPEGALTGLYGTKGVRTLIPFLSNIYAPKGLQVCPVDVGFDMSFDPTKYCGNSDSDIPIESTSILSMLRLRADLRDEVQEAWADALQFKYRGKEREFPQKPTAKPEFLEELRKRKTFKHIDTFIYPVATKAGVFPVVSTWRKPVLIKPWVELPAKVTF